MSFTSIIRNSERKYIFLLIIICFLHGFHGFIYSCIPFIFFDPILTCSNTINGVTNYFPCDQNTACDNFPYKIDYASSRQSITTEFELICSKRYIKPTIQSFISFGCTITALILSFVRLNPYQRSRTIMISYFIALVCAIISSFLKNIWAITFVLFISYLFSYVWISNIYTYASETFEPKLKKIVPSIMAICFGIFTMIFSLFTMVVSNWRYYVTFFYGIPPLIFLILFYLYNKKHNFQPKNLRVIYIFPLF